MAAKVQKRTAAPGQVYVLPGVCGGSITLEELWDVMDEVREDW